MIENFCKEQKHCFSTFSSFVAVPKHTFSQLLMQLTNQIKPKFVANLIAGFEKSGLVPLNKNEVIDHLPYDTNLENTNGESVSNEGVSESDALFLEILKEMRCGNGDQEGTKRKRKRKIDVAPGKSITGADFVEEHMSNLENDYSEAEELVVEEREVSERGEEESFSDDEKSEKESNTSHACQEQTRRLLKRKAQDCTVNRSDADNIEKMNIGDYVIFEYQGELFPRVVTGIVAEKGGCSIKSMRSGINWKWPKVHDEMFYNNEDIKKKIKRPKQLNRGIMEVEKLKERWGQ